MIGELVKSPEDLDFPQTFYYFDDGLEEMTLTEKQWNQAVAIITEDMSREAANKVLRRVSE